ncbi:MAG: ImmA/IrrE family metallo-endopeptidase [Acidobacteria bacterium]|nr:ImmA/IrrE family metallo-endopeptidase [Acidobacteriota bacterium]
MTPAGRRESDPRAEALLMRFTSRFGAVDGPVPVDALATDLLGLFVIESDDIEVSGLLVPDTRYVYLNAREARESAGRRRFTLAHEIGHWVCQCDEGRSESPEPIMCRPADMSAKVDTALEREANNFAASLLMPEGRVRDAANRGMDVDAAAELFGVSDIAMEWRYFNLEITDQRPKRS